MRTHRDESGIALVSVLGLTLLATVLVSAAVTYTMNGLPRVRGHEDWNAALAAAEAGIEDVQARLNLDPRFYSTGTPNAAQTGWRTIPGANSRGRYHYRIDATQVARTGAIDVVSTGRVGDQTRTIEARLRREGFLDYIYFTDYEASDPFALTENAGARTALDDHCARYYPDRPEANVNVSSPRSGGCGTIQFAPGDVTRGPLRTNDAILAQGTADGPNYYGPVLTGWTGDGGTPPRLFRLTANSTRDPVFHEGITTAPRIDVPETGDNLFAAARDTGCVYTGPTYIRFHGTAANPRMDVISPLSRGTSVGAGCAPGRNIALRNGQVLYVQNRSSSSGVTQHPLRMNRADVTNPSTTTTRNDVTQNLPKFGNTVGDAFVHGRLHGQVTVAAQNDVVVVHDLTYGTGESLDGTDLLGLIADNNVSVYHPIALRTWEQRSCFGSYCWWTATSSSSNVVSVGRGVAPFNTTQPSSSNVAGTSNSADTNLPATATTWQDPRIHAAILALKRSFGVQQYNRGNDLGTLRVFGAIAQKWRGPVATTGNTGYLKDYNYDYRLQNLSPPHFLSPTDSPWGRRTWAEPPDPPRCTGTQSPPTTACLPA